MEEQLYKTRCREALLFLQTFIDAAGLRLRAMLLTEFQFESIVRD